jgi:terminase large subunit-like protein
MRLLRLKSRPAPSAVTLIDAMADPQLFGPWFKNAGTWRTWRAFLRALFGLRMNPFDLAMYRRHTGREKNPRSQAREAWLVVGRRGGKSFIVALIAVYLACFREYRSYLAPGERATVMVLAADRRQARVVMRFITALLEDVPMLARMIERIGAESIDLSNSVTLEIHTASFRSVRGYTVAAAICDEIAFWRDESSANPDVEILDALRPAMSTIPGALLLGLSSPYARRGALWDAYEQHYGHNGDVLVWQADTRAMNPTIPQSVIDRAYADDPAAAAAEYGANWRSDIEGFLQPEWISAAVREGVHEIARVPGTSYAAFTDPSGGASDAFTLGIAHGEDKRLILDVCRARRPPFDPKTVVAEFADVLKRYGLYQVTGDRYSGEWVVSAFREHGVHYQPSERTKSDIYLEVLPQFATGAVQLLDNRALLTELRQLERITGRGKDIVDHPPRGHDDCANAACGALLHAVRSGPVDMTQAFVITAAEARAARDQHLAEDLGYSLGDDTNDRDSPFNLGDRE